MVALRKPEDLGAGEARRDILYLTHEEAEPRLLRWIAAPFGIDTLEARTGESAEDAVLRVSPALVLMDLAAFTSARSRTLRRLHAAYPDLPIIAVFDRFDSRSLALALQDGATDYLTRPLDFTRWWAKIMPRIEGAAAHAEVAAELVPAEIEPDDAVEQVIELHPAGIDLWT